MKGRIDSVRACEVEQDLFGQAGECIWEGAGRRGTSASKLPGPR
jgi:hypothetical protein